MATRRQAQLASLASLAIGALAAAGCSTSAANAPPPGPPPPPAVHVVTAEARDVRPADELSGKLEALYRYVSPNGDVGFYNADGTNVKKALLRTPVDGARISSSFGMRHHPILGFTRMHQGVDFAVPAGTPIMASGDATVLSAGWAGGYGNMVVLRHNGSYATAYGHMSRIARGIKPGVYVRQGEVIGYVGMTGLATGPHLHYEVRVDSKAINPLGVRLAATQKLEGGALADFRVQEVAIAKRVAALRNDGKFAQK